MAHLRLHHQSDVKVKIFKSDDVKVYTYKINCKNKKKKTIRLCSADKRVNISLRPRTFKSRPWGKKPSGFMVRRLQPVDFFPREHAGPQFDPPTGVIVRQLCCKIHRCNFHKVKVLFHGI